MYYMHKFISFIKEFKFPKKEEILNSINSFSEKELFTFFVSSIVCIISLFFIISKLNNMMMVEVPESGGTITEGIIGTPTLVNPVLAISDADKDLTSIVYSGLMRKTSNGEFIPDLAESYTVSPDGKNYTFIIKKDAKFHDGQSITAKDVSFTISKIQDPIIKSPRKMDWSGVTVTEKDDYTVIFTLKQPYISFMDNMTMGILPSHIWKNVTSAEFNLSISNIKAIGSGPYQITKVTKDSNGIPKEYYLKYFKNFTLSKPHIKNLNIISYSNENDLTKALQGGYIDQASGISPDKAEILRDKGFNIYTTTLPRVFGIFFNKNKNKIFSDPVVINAINNALDKQEIINQILSGYGTIINSPIPETIIKDQEIKEFKESDIESINTSLEKDGWKLGTDGVRAKGGTTTVNKTKKVGKKNIIQKVTTNNGSSLKLAFSINTGDSQELKDGAKLIQDQLSKIGIQVDIKVYETGQLNQLIRERNYEALLFGQVINHESNLFSFWQSSQKTDPGLNIAMYDNKKVDSLLENAQKTFDDKARNNIYKSLESEFKKDVPAILIYSPKFIYVTSSNIRNIPFDNITIPSDRFMSIHTWYANMDKVWKIFTK